MVVATVMGCPPQQRVAEISGAGVDIIMRGCIEGEPNQDCAFGSGVVPTPAQLTAAPMHAQLAITNRNNDQVLQRSGW